MQKVEYNPEKFHKQERYTCPECKTAVDVKSFVVKLADRQICIPCYIHNYAHKCSKCSGVCTSVFGFIWVTKN